jgi:hypothetical protein
VERRRATVSPCHSLLCISPLPTYVMIQYDDTLSYFVNVMSIACFLLVGCVG